MPAIPLGPKRSMASPNRSSEVSLIRFLGDMLGTVSGGKLQLFEISGSQEVLLCTGNGNRGYPGPVGDWHPPDIYVWYHTVVPVIRI